MHYLNSITRKLLVLFTKKKHKLKKKKIITPYIIVKPIHISLHFRI